MLFRSILNQGYGQALATAQQQQQLGLGAAQANRAALQAAGQQLAGIGRNAGAVKADQLPMVHSLWKRLSTLANGFGTGQAAVAVLILLSLALIFRGSRGAAKESADRADRLMLLACGVMSSQYFAWWMFATPDEKAWIRRVLIGVVFFALQRYFVRGLLAGAVKG